MIPLPLPLTPPVVHHWAGPPFVQPPATPALIALNTPADWQQWQALRHDHEQTHWLVLGPQLLSGSLHPANETSPVGIYTCPRPDYAPRLPLPYHAGGLEALRRLNLRLPGQAFLLTDTEGITDAHLWAELVGSLRVQVLLAGPPEQASALLKLVSSYR